MRGAMMHFPLTPTHVLERAGTLYGESQIVSRLPDKSLIVTATRIFTGARAHWRGRCRGWVCKRGGASRTW